MASSLQKGIDSAKLGQMDLALSYLKDAIIEEPENANVWVWLAAIIEDEAKQTIFLKKALEIDPNNHPAQRGMAYIERKKTTPAKAGEKLSDYTKPIGLFKRDTPPPQEESRQSQPERQVTSAPTRGDNPSPQSRTLYTTTASSEPHKADKTAWLDVVLYMFILLVFVFIGFLVGSTLLKVDIPFLTPVEKTIELPALPEAEGVYLYNGVDYAQIQNHLGVPEYEEGIPVTDNKQPWILIKQTKAPHPEFVFQFEDGAIVAYSDNLVNDEASLLIPDGKLSQGLYCLIESESTEAELPNYWCFRIQ